MRVRERGCRRGSREAEKMRSPFRTLGSTSEDCKDTWASEDGQLFRGSPRFPASTTVIDSVRRAAARRINVRLRVSFTSPSCGELTRRVY